MNGFIRSGRGVRLLVGLLMLCGMAAQAAAEDNIWQSTFGQGWFYESRAWSGQTLAGTWWEASLTPGHSYRISFQVQNLNGKVGLFVGNREMLTLDHTGWYSYDFKVWDGGQRRLMFTTQSRDVTAGVNQIVVKRTTSGSDTTASTSWSSLPKGHYWSFDRQRNLETEMANLIDNPASAPSGWHLGIAQDLHTALTTAGVKGFSMLVDWRTLETGDGKFNWSLLDANMRVARRLGLKFIIQVSTRSFDGSNVMPGYFPSQYVIWSQGGGGSGFVAKLWDPWVYNRLIRLYQQIAWRYNDDPAFGGIATSETALGNLSGGDYSYWKYRTALVKIATAAESALKTGKFFFYLNFLPGGDSSDMNQDGRVSLVNSIPHKSLVFGGPDITPDRPGMPGSMTSVRIHLRKTDPDVQQFCAAQNTDLGQGGINRKSNQSRWDYLNRVQRVRQREQQSWFNGPKAVFRFDDIRNGAGQNVHPDWDLGALWKPSELFNFADRNFQCDYFLWNYRENVFHKSTEFWWYDVRPVIVNNQYFYK